MRAYLGRVLALSVSISEPLRDFISRNEKLSEQQDAS